MIELKCNAYSPASLAKELDGLYCTTSIRTQIKLGKLKAKRLGGRNIIILKAWAQEWLEGLPSATEPTNYHGRTNRKGRPKLTEEEKQRRLDKAAKAIEESVKPKKRKTTQAPRPSRSS